MTYSLSHPTKTISGTIQLTASKSESNRALIIQALCEEEFKIENIAAAQDTATLQGILKTRDSVNTLDVGPAGTTMRFLTAFLATQSGEKILTGSERMKKRPIGILVEALKKLGAKIEYLENEGYPPLKITGGVLKGGEIELDGSVSSQFISALLLISPSLQNGLIINFKGKVVSKPYIDMTLKMMQEFRVYGQWQGNSISVSPQKYRKKSEQNYSYKVDGDWSAASYWYSIAALAKEVDLKIIGLKHPSLQGDAILPELYTFFGVKTTYFENGIHLTRSKVKDEHFGFNFSDCPDIAQTIAITASALQIPAFFNGLETLVIKETDRLSALKKELQKFNVSVKIENNNSITIEPGGLKEPSEQIETYEDHRMAMAFAPFALKCEKVKINDPEVVNKSYPGFWNDLKLVGFNIEE